MEHLTEMFTHWTNMFLIWVGFGTVVGLLAKAIFPGRDPGGAFATLIIGVFGSLIGAGILAFFTGERVTPISIPGFVVAVSGTMMILGCYRILNGRGFFKDGMGGFRSRHHHGRKISIVEEK